MEKLEKVILAAKSLTKRRLYSWQTEHRSLQGDKHVRDGAPCQDASNSGVLDGGTWAYLVVADGHGSERHFRSDRGAQLAVSIMNDVFHSFRRRVDVVGEPDVAELDQLWVQETDKLVEKWRAKVYVDLLQHPARVPGKTEGERGLVRYLDDFTRRNGYAQLERLFWQLRQFEAHTREVISRETGTVGPLPYSNEAGWDQAKYGGWQAKAYGTTLLGVLVGPESLHWVQLGDGAMVQILGGEPCYLVSPPEEALGNLTPSLCDDDAQLKLRTGSVELKPGQTPSAILLTTDGVSNSYAEQGGFFAFCKEAAIHADTSPAFSADLPRWLQLISREGSGDDVSIALAWLRELPEKPARTPKHVQRHSPEEAGGAAEPAAGPDVGKPGRTRDERVEGARETGFPESDPPADRQAEPERVPAEPPDPAGSKQQAGAVEVPDKGGDQDAEGGRSAQL